MVCNNRKYDRYIYILGGIGLLLLCVLGKGNCVKQGSQVQQAISKEIIRFHVIADNDSTKAQEVKLKIRDEILKNIQPKLEGITDISKARIVMKNELKNIEEISKQVMEAEGVSYPVKAVLEKREFPIKIYGDLAFPSGEYEALDVKIGNAAGKNWWCVMFPSLCVVDGTYQVVPEDKKEELKKTVGEENYEILVNGEEEKVSSVEFDCGLMNWWSDLWK